MCCCPNCFSREAAAIAGWIRATGTIGDCGYCGSRQVPQLPVGEAGRLLKRCLARAYEHADRGTGVFYDPEEQGYLAPDGTPAELLSVCEIVFYEHPAFSDAVFARRAERRLLEDLIDGSPEDGPFERPYEPILVFSGALYGVDNTQEHYSWSRFKHICKHYNRFFDVDGATSPRERLLQQLDGLFAEMAHTLQPGEEALCRVRLVKDDSWQDAEPYQAIAPAPRTVSPHNRMSPAGISYSYLADGVHTCLLETRAKVGDRALVGHFTTKVPLRLLDLSQRPVLTPRSIYDQDYDHSRHWLHEFVAEFAQEISRPVRDGDKPIDYVPTQVLAEYIRKLGFHGIKFASSHNPDSFNYTLFCGPPGPAEEWGFTRPHIVSFADWLRLDRLELLEVTGLVYETLAVQEEIPPDGDPLADWEFPTAVL